MKTCTVLGATGKIGSVLLNRLSESHVPTRAFFRNAEKIQTMPHVSWCYAGSLTADQLEPALAGTTSLFILSANYHGFSTQQIKTVKAAQRVGVNHIVKVSAIGASENSQSFVGREHWEVEQEIKASKINYTILRPHSFMQNFLWEFADDIRMENKFYSPVGDGKVPYIDARDIADCAHDILLNPKEHLNKTYVLTGPEVTGFKRLAESLSYALGRDIQYVSISEDEARQRMEHDGYPEHLIESLISLARYQRNCPEKSIAISPDLENILKRRARTVDDFASDYAEEFI
jgi:uncharacterized protein YbjT (DUF2867 family)